MLEQQNATNGSHVSSDLEHSKFTSVVLIIMALIIFVENAAVCVLFAGHEKLRTTTNVFVFSLACSDLLVGVVFVPVYLGTPVGHPANPFVVTFLLFSSLLNLCGVTYDRYHAILQPLTYRAVFTCRRITTTLVAIWFVPLLFIALPLTWGGSQDLDFVITINRLYQGLMVFVVFFTCVVVSKIYFDIFGAIRRQLKMTRHVRDMFGPSESTSEASMDIKTPSQWPSDHLSHAETTPLGPESPQIKPACRSKPDPLPNDLTLRKNLSRQLKKLRFKKHSENLLNDIRAVKLFAFIVLIFVICWLPAVIINFMVAIGRVTLVPKFIFDVSVYAFVANALVNPLVYTFYKSDYRLALLETTGCKRKKKQFNVSTDLLKLTPINLK